MKSILLVKDSKFMRVANKRTLTKAGFRVVTAGDGEEALRMAYDHVPDLILPDLLLPKLGGPSSSRFFDFAREEYVDLFSGTADDTNSGPLKGMLMALTSNTTAQ